MIATANITRKDASGKVRPHYKLVAMEARLPCMAGSRQVVHGRELAEHVALEGAMRESTARSLFLQARVVV